jgi:hypothetical protein
LYQDLLHTIAEVAITLAGFSGVVFILGNRSEGRFTQTERNGLFHLLLTSCGNTVVALVVAAILAGSADETVAWRTGCGLVGVFVLFGAGRAMAEEKRGEHSLPRFVAWPIPVFAILLALANVVIASGFFVGFAHIACISLLIYLILVSVLYFASLLVPDNGP